MPHNSDATMGYEAGIQPEAKFPAIPGYEVTAELGRGGMGVVYQARQLKLNRIVALKMVLAGAHASERARARFLAEAEIAAGLQHSNIVQIYELGEYDGLPFIAMEYVTGGGMAMWIAKRRGKYQEVAELFEKLARAAHWAHQRSIVHRDLKPANVLIGGDGEPKIGDFGLAKRLGDSEGPRLTLSGEKMGTPDYMAPEQAFSELGAISPATDGYALGAMLYEALCGQVPIRGRSEMDWLRRLHHEDPPSPAYYSAGIPRDLETICMKCLRKRPGERYASAEALAEDLRRFQEHQPIEAKPLSPLTKTWRWVRRRAGKIAALFLLLAVLIGGGLWWRHQYLYVWETTEYFAETQRIHGEYHGRGQPLTDTERAHRYASLRLVRAGTRGRLLRMESVDSAGRHRWSSSLALPPDVCDALPPRNQPCQNYLRYNEEGFVSEERLLDRVGQTVVIVRYSYPPNFQPGSSVEPVRADLRDEHGAIVKTTTGIEGWQLFRDKAGRERIVRFINSRDESVADKSGAFGWRLEWNEKNLLGSLTYLNREGTPAPNRFGVAGVRVEYDSQSRPTRHTNVNEKGVNASADGIGAVTNAYDQWGNLVESSHFAIDGRTPARKQSDRYGFLTFRRQYDGAGFPTKEQLIGFDPEKAGFSQKEVDYAWKSDGSYSQVTTTFNEKGVPAGRDNGSKIEEEFDSQLRLLRRVSSGWDSKVAGFFGYRQLLEWGQGDYPRRRTTEYFDEKNQRAWHLADGYGRRIDELDDEGREVLNVLEEFKPETRPHFRKIVTSEWAPSEDAGLRGGFIVRPEDLDLSTDAEQTMSNHPRRTMLGSVDGKNRKYRRVHGRYETREGQLTANNEGNTEYVKEFDAKGLVTETHKGFDEARLGYAYRVLSESRSADETRVVSWRFFSATGQPVARRDHVLNYEERFDAKGRYLGFKSELDPSSGTAFAQEVMNVTWETDGSRASWKRRYDAGGKPVPLSSGYLDHREKFDARERPTEVLKSGGDESKIGHEREVISVIWNPDGTCSKFWRYFNAAGQAVPNKEGYLDYEERFDAEQRHIFTKRSGYRPVKSYHAEVREYLDFQGPKYRRVLWHYEDEKGTRIRWEGQYFEYDERIDENGVVTRFFERGYDPDRFPYHTRLVETGPRVNGHRTRIYSYLDASGTEQRGPQGELHEERTLQANGSLALRRLHGFDEAHHGFVECILEFTASQSGNEDAVVKSAGFRDSQGRNVARIHVYIRSMEREAVAAKLGLKVGDRLVASNGIPIVNSADFLANRKPLAGDLQIEREGKLETIQVPRGKLGVFLEDRAAK